MIVIRKWIGRIWKEAVVAQMKYYPVLLLERLSYTMQISVSIVGDVIWIRTTHLPSKNLENYAIGAVEQVTIIHLCAVRYLIFV